MLGRGPWAVLGPCRARPGPPASLDLVLPRAARAALAARGDRQTADRRAPARPPALRRSVCHSVGVDAGAELPRRLAPVSLLARAGLDQYGLAARAGAAPV